MDSTKKPRTKKTSVEPIVDEPIPQPIQVKIDEQKNRMAPLPGFQPFGGLTEDLRFGAPAQYGYQLFQGVSFIMPNPDPILKKLGPGADTEIYRSLMNDPQLKGAVENNRKAGTTALNMKLDDSNVPKEESAVITNFFKRLTETGDYRTILNQSLDTPLYGRVTFALKWDMVDGYFLPVSIAAVPYQFCFFDYLGNALYSTTGVMPSIPSDPARYIGLRYKPTIENPYGEALLSSCYWNIQFKKSGLQDWVVYMDKYGIPMIKANYDFNALKMLFPDLTAEDAAAFLVPMLGNMAKGGAVVLPKEITAEPMKFNDRSSEMVFEVLIRLCDEQNTKLILGHSGATESTSGDKLSNDHTVTDVRKSIIESDREFPKQFFNQVIGLIHYFNFTGPNQVVYDLISPEEIDMIPAQRDAILVPTMAISGLTLTDQYYVNNYGFKPGDIRPLTVMAPPAPALPSPATPKTKADAMEILKAYAAEIFLSEAKIDPKQHKDQILIDEVALDHSKKTEDIDTSLKPVMDYLEKQTDYKTAIAGLAKIFPKMPSEELQSKLTQVLFMADILGRVTAAKEVGIDITEKKK